MGAVLQGKKLVFPWDIAEVGGRLEGFAGSQVELDTVLWNLSRLHYPYDRLTKTKPAASVVKASKLVLALMDQRMTKKRPPWVLVVSESMQLLQALAQVVPVTWALTLKRSCFNVDSEQLMELFSTPRPRDDFETDPVGDLLHELVGTGLLVWEQISAQVYGTKGRGGQFSNLLSKRFAKLRPLLVTSYMPDGFSEVAASQMMRNIGERYGPTVQGLLEQEAELHYFKVKTKTPKWVGDEI